MKIGIDLGGSHIAIAVISENKNIIEKFETDIVSKQNIQQFIENTIVTEVSRFCDKYDIEKIGIAVPGIVENQKIANLFNLGIGQYDIIKKLNEFGLKNIYIKNDGVCAAIAEMKFGSLKTYDNSIFLCLGTGIGGAVCQNGEAIPSNKNLGFEFGHMQIEKQEKQICKCGKINCFEIYGSIKKLKSDLKNELEIETCNGKLLHDEILKNKDNVNVQKIIEKYINEIVYGISKISNIMKPQAICLGGGFTYYSDLLFDKFVNEFSKGKFLETTYVAPKIVVAEFKNDAGMIGAANIETA